MVNYYKKSIQFGSIFKSVNLDLIVIIIFIYQRKVAEQSNIEGCGEFSLNHEKNIQLESIKNEFEGLNVRMF